MFIGAASPDKKPWTLSPYRAKLLSVIGTVTLYTVGPLGSSKRGFLEWLSVMIVCT